MTYKIFCDSIKKLYSCYIAIMQQHVAPLLLLAIRIWIGLVFVRSGLTKFSNIDQAIILFEYEYQLPLLSPAFAAIMATIVELGCGFAVIGGFLTRIAVIPLIIMTLVIQFLVVQNPEHFYWFFLLSTLTIYGGGCISVDGIYTKFFQKKKQ